MIRNEELKESIPFVDGLPNHWDILPNKYLFKYDGKKVGEDFANYQLLSLTTSGIKEKDINDKGGKVPDSYNNYQTVKKGQMIFCLFDLDCSAVFSGRSSFDGMITSAYDVFSTTNLMNSKFADYWFKYVFSNRYYMLFSKNIRYTVSEDMFNSLKTPVPPMKEQQRIAGFLDKKCAQIDELIKLQENEIEKLKEYRTSLITEKVFGESYDISKVKEVKDICLKTIPSHWDFLKTSKVFNVITDFVASGSFADLAKNVEYLSEPGYALLVRTADLSGSRDNKVYISKESYDFLHNSNLFGGEIILPNIGSVGDVYLVPNMYEKMSLGPNAIMLKSKYLDKYYYYYFASKIGRVILNNLCEATAQQKFNKTNFREMKICVPPIEEQFEIIDFLDKKCYVVDNLIEKKKDKIKKLQDYKKSLIYECVTGKRRLV